MLFQDALNTSLTPILHCESALALDLVFQSQASLKTCLLFGGRSWQPWIYFCVFRVTRWWEEPELRTGKVPLQV